MKFSWILVLVALVAVAVPLQGFASDSIGNSGRGVLDLPSGGESSRDDSEEDSPESIVFYGGEYEGDCYVFVFPAYGFCGDTTVFANIRVEVTNALNQLSSQADFDLIGFNATTFAWQPAVVEANAANKGSAIAWMNTLVPVEQHEIVEATVTALGISQAADSQAKQMIVCGARAPFGGDGAISNALIQITEANYESTPMHTVYFSTPFYSGEESFYQQLASMNGGTFKHVAY